MKFKTPIYLLPTKETLHSLRSNQTEEDNERMIKARTEYLYTKVYSSEDHLLAAKSAFTDAWLIATIWEEVT